MMKSSNRKLKLVGVIHHGLQVRHSVAMSINVNLTTKRGSQSLPRNNLRQILIHPTHTHLLSLRTPIILLLNQLPRLLKSMSEIVALAHAAKWPSANPAMHTLRILAAGHLHVSPRVIRVGEQVICADLLASVGLSDCVLDHVGFAADVVARAGEDERGGDAAGLDDLDLGVEGEDGVDGAGPGSDVVRHFIAV